MCKCLILIYFYGYFFFIRIMNKCMLLNIFRVIIVFLFCNFLNIKFIIDLELIFIKDIKLFYRWILISFIMNIK